MQRSILFLWVCAAAALAAALFAYFFIFSEPAASITPEHVVFVDDVRVAVEIADSPEEREQGLGGTAQLENGEGMLFVFEADGTHSFWMKGMQYSIDILWISAEKRVVHIEKALSPSTFPQSFTSPTPARYVLEVPAGFSDMHGIREGSEMKL